MEVHACNPTPWRWKQEGGKFETSLGSMRPYFKKTEHTTCYLVGRGRRLIWAQEFVRCNIDPNLKKKKKTSMLFDLKTFWPPLYHPHATQKQGWPLAFDSWELLNVISKCHPSPGVSHCVQSLRVVFWGFALTIFFVCLPFSNLYVVACLKTGWWWPELFREVLPWVVKQVDVTTSRFVTLRNCWLSKPQI